MAEGLRVGARVGRSEGLRLGRRVGLALGAYVGVALGLLVERQLIWLFGLVTKPTRQ